MPVKLADLVEAHDWLEADAEGDNVALVCPESGAVHLFRGEDNLDPDGPGLDEIGDSCISAPDRNDLGLGRRLVFRYVRDALPALEAQVQDFFRHRGAYGNFKSLLYREGRLDDWHAYEEAAKEAALLEWAEAMDLVVERP